MVIIDYRPSTVVHRLSFVMSSIEYDGRTSAVRVVRVDGRKMSSISKDMARGVGGGATLMRGDEG